MNYPGFTNEEIATVVAYTISSYPEDARRRFRATFQKEVPPRTTLIGWAKRFKATLSLAETARVGDHSERRALRPEVGFKSVLSYYVPLTTFCEKLHKMDSPHPFFCSECEEWKAGQFR